MPKMRAPCCESSGRLPAGMLMKIIALAIVLAGLSLATTAGAETQRVAVLQPDEQLLRAITLSLSPWELETIRSDAPLPTTSQPEAVEAASLLARQLDVDAVVWMTARQGGSLLWVFDVGAGDVTTRMLPESPPLDGAAAAAVALSVKTILRASVIAPPDERFGSRKTTPEPSRNWAVELGAGGHWIHDDHVDLRVELAGVFWLPIFSRLGATLELASGPGVSIEEVEYAGRYRVVVAGAKARWRLLDTAGLSTVIAVGGSAHWAVLDGTLAVDGSDSRVSRVNGAVDLETSVHFMLTSRFYLGAAIGATYHPTVRRYLVDGDPVFAPRALTVNLSGYCGVELF